MKVPRLTVEQEVMFFDTDCGGVVHNIAYLRMIEVCRTKLADQIGMSLKNMSETGVFAVVVRTEIDYSKPAMLGDKLLIHGCLSKLERVKFWCDFVIMREGENKPLIKCQQAMALVKMPEGRPQRIPKEWAEACLAAEDE